MFDCAPRFLLHDIPQTRIIGSRRTIRDREIESCDIAREEHGDVVDLRWLVPVFRWEGKIAIAADVEGYLEEIWEWLERYEGG